MGLLITIFGFDAVTETYHNETHARQMENTVNYKGKLSTSWGKINFCQLNAGKNGDIINYQLYSI
jgi:hypothetical protein